MSETVIHRQGKDRTPVQVYGTVEDVQAALDHAREDGSPWASFSTTDGRTAHISPDSVDRLEAAD